MPASARRSVYRMARYCDPRSEWGDQPRALCGPALVDGLLQGVEHEARRGRPARPPADDAPRVGVDDEGDVDEAGPSRHVGEVADPQPIRCGRMELPVHAVQRAGCCRVLDRRPHGLPPHHAPQPHHSHQPLHGAPGHRDALAAQLPPDLPRAVDAEVFGVHTRDLGGAARRLVGRAPRPGRGRAARRRARGTSTGRSAADGRSARPRGRRGDRR